MHVRGLVIFVGGVFAALAFAPVLYGLGSVPAFESLTQLDPIRHLLDPVIGLLAVVLVVAAIATWPLLTGWWRSVHPRRGRRSRRRRVRH